MLTLYHNNKQYPMENTEYYIRELANGLDEVVFSLPIHDPIYAIINEEEQITDRAGQTYKVKQIDGGASDAKIVCQLDIDDWKSTLNVNYNSGTKTVAQQITAILPTGWSLNDRSGSVIGRTIEGDLTPYDICVECTNVYAVYIRWDNKTKQVTVYPKAMGAPVGAFATRELNLKEINYKGKSNDLVTRLYAYGKDGLSFADINGGKPYVDNFDYTTQIICGIWRDDRYEVKQNLLDDAQAKLAIMARPNRTYECAIIDLQATNPDLYNNLDFSLFTAATLIDDVKNNAVDYQVVERHIYPYHPDKNEVIFNSEPLKITTTVTNIANAIENPNSAFQQIQQARIAEATNWLLSGDGYVVAVKGADGEWKELLFMDTNDEATAQKVIRINENGIGFSTTGINGPYTNAWTIDGKLNADFILTGTMVANRIKGGTLELGGQNNGNGTISIKDNTGTEIATITRTGISFNSGKFTVNNAGEVTASSVSLTGTINATGGYIGDNSTNGWNIGTNNIHNGPATLTDTSTAGTYVGVNGIRTNGSNGQTTSITGGVISSNQTMTAYNFETPTNNAGIYSTNGGTVYGGRYETNESGSVYTGTSGQLAWTANGHAYGFTVKNGIVIAIAST